MGVVPDRLVSQNCTFIWKFTGRTLESGHFSSVFEGLDFLDFEIGVKNARETQIFSILRFKFKQKCLLLVLPFFGKSLFSQLWTGKSQI